MELKFEVNEQEIVDKVSEKFKDDFISKSVIEGIKKEIEAKAREREFYLDIGHPHDGLYEALEIIEKHISGKEQDESSD